VPLWGAGGTHCGRVGSSKGRPSKGGTGVHPLDGSAESDYGRARYPAMDRDIESILMVLKVNLEASVPWRVVVQCQGYLKHKNKP